jgi:hypothetical protein
MQKITSWLLIGLCLQLFVPRELWHELTGHHDTSDLVCHEHDSDVSAGHEHCLIFDLTGDPILYNGVKSFQFFQVALIIILFGAIDIKCRYYTLSFSNKGPPTK